MKRPWEETWTVQRYVIEIDGYPIGQFTDDGPEPDESENGMSHRDRATLAAQAPAMARLLLEFATGTDGYDTDCLACGCIGKHLPDCKIVDVLRAAGVIE